ncbi:MAG: PIN domain-containing protein [Planctomycetes bacterium]|nr:PIN domain-containing protein [Planctomycetota bacterium]
MRIEEALDGVSAVLMDSAPAIYHLERNPIYAERMTSFFAARARRGVLIVTSPVTLAECLVHPLRLGLADLEASYHTLIVEGEDTEFHTIGEQQAACAARTRATYDLRLADAFQVAVATHAGCQAILTNDPVFKRVHDIRALILDELEP